MKACLLPAQQTDTLFTQLDSTDSAGNHLWHKQKMVITRTPAKPEPLYPWGEISLKRLRKTEIRYSLLSAADTIKLLITNKDGIPFKTVQWGFAADQVVTRENSAVLDTAATPPDSTHLRVNLRIRPSFSLNRQVAVVHLQRVPPVRSDTAIYTLDSLAPAATVAGMDTLLRHYYSVPRGKMLLTGWEGTQQLSGNRRLWQRGQLVGEPRPGQKKQLLPAGPNLLSRWGATRSIPYSDFQRGDTLIFAVTATGTPVQEIYLTRQDNSVVNRLTNTLLFADTLVANGETSLTLHLRGKLSLKKNAPVVSVLRIRPAKADSVYVVTDSLLQTKSASVSDTLLLTVTDDSLLLSPIWDIDHEPYGQIEVQIPQRAGEGYELLYAAWWLGVGPACIDEYRLLEASVPADWSKPGAPPALGAYGFGRSLILPATGVDEVFCKFSKTLQKELVKTEQATAHVRFSPKPKKGLVKSGQSKPLGGLPEGRNAGTLLATAHNDWSVPGISRATGGASYNFYACFQNTSTVNNYPLALKVAGFYRKTTPLPPQILPPKVETYKIPIAK